MISSDKKVLVETGWPYAATYHNRNQTFDQETSLNAILDSLAGVDYYVFEAFSSDLPAKTVYKVNVSNPRVFALDDFSVIVGTHQKVDEFLDDLQKQTHWQFNGKEGVTITEIVYHDTMFGQSILDGIQSE